MNKKQYAVFSKAIRAMAGAPGSSYPIIVVEGDTPPDLKGRSHYWTTPGGKIIRYPGAYRWKKVYHASTLHITVGQICLSECNLPCPDKLGQVKVQG